MFSEFPKLFDRNFAIGYLIPSVVLLLGIQGLLSAFQIVSLPSFMTDTNPIVGSAVVALFAWLVGILFLGANRDIIRALEGYGTYNPLKVILPIEKKKFLTLQDKIASLQNKKRNEKEEDERNRLLREAVTNFPDNVKFVLPTPFGNAVRAFEVYPRLMYGVESVVVWSRLLTVIPADYKTHIDNAKANMDFWINLGVSTILLFILSIGLRIYAVYQNIAVISILFWILVVIEVAVIYVCQYRATRNAIIWGQTVKSAFDVYLPDLATKLGLKMTEDREAQRLVWENYGIAILYARKDYLPELKKTQEEATKPENEGLLAKIVKFLLGD